MTCPYLYDHLLSHNCPSLSPNTLYWCDSLFYVFLNSFSNYLIPFLSHHMPSTSSLSASQDTGHCHCVYCLSVQPRLMSVQASCSIPIHPTNCRHSFHFFPVIVHEPVFLASSPVCCGKCPSYRSLDHSFHSWHASRHYQGSSQM